MNGSKVVFVGNIPYEQTEEQLIDIFSEVGPVVSFRLVFERETGKPRGYGFCEFQDERTAASAVRNLNGREIGNRSLKVDFADSDPARSDGRDLEDGSFIMNIGPRSNQGPPPMAPHQMPQMPFLNPQQQRIDPRLANNQPAMPLGSNISLAPGPTAPGTGLSSADSISAVLATMTPQNVFDIIASMKVLAVNEPDKATALLNANPQLSYAIFQALIMMNMIEPTMLQRMFPQSVPAPGGTAPAVPPHMPPLPMVPPLPFVPPVFAGVQQPPQQPPMPSHVPQVPASQPSLEQQQQLLAQVMALTPADIASLPEEQRANILKLRATLLGGA